MQNVDIPRESWPEFLAEFADAHHEWLVNVKIVGGGSGDSADDREVPFAGIDYDSGKSTITLHTGREQGSVSHTVADPERVRLLTRADGVEEALQIESAHGTRLLMHFLSPQPTAAVDGMP